MAAGQTSESDGEWVGGLVQIPAYATDAVTPYRPEALFWLDATGSVCAAQLGKPGELASLATEILRQTIAAQAREGERAPTRVRVASAELARALRSDWPTLDVVCAPTPEVDALLDRMREQFAQDAVEEQSYLAGDADVPSMAALFAAAAALYRAEPWRGHLPRLACVLVTIRGLDIHDAVLAFTGAPGRSPGVVLLQSLAHFKAYCAALPLLARGDRPALPSHLALNFERGAELSLGQRKEIDTHRWEVAGPDAYPWLVILDEDLVARAPTPAEILLAEVLARALSWLVTEHRAELYAACQGDAPLRRQLEVMTRRGRLEVLWAAPAPDPVPQLGHGKLAANTGMASPCPWSVDSRDGAS